GRHGRHSRKQKRRKRHKAPAPSDGVNGPAQCPREEEKYDVVEVQADLLSRFPFHTPAPAPCVSLRFIKTMWRAAAPQGSPKSFLDNARLAVYERCDLRAFRH